MGPQQGPVTLVTVPVTLKLGDVVDVSGLIEAHAGIQSESAYVAGYTSICWVDPTAGAFHQALPYRFQAQYYTQNLVVPAGTTFTVNANSGGAGTYQISICGQTQTGDVFTANVKSIKV